MFTGIIEARGVIHAIEFSDDSARIVLNAQSLDMADVSLGDSIAVSGPCLTVVEFDEHRFAVDVSSESLKLTTLGSLTVGDTVNLEKAMRLSDRLGGHIVSGHIDGIGEVLAREDSDEYAKFRIQAPENLARYIAKKGSICVDGISLTVNEVSHTEFELMIIPHTLAVTTLGARKVSDRVNLEIDVVARYCERLLSASTDT